MIVTLTVNGEPRTVTAAGVESLLDVLRDRLGLPGSKDACRQGECGSCSVVVDGELVCSCLVMIGDAEGSNVTTVEGVAPDGDLHAVQRSFLGQGAAQCGFCTPGLVVAASHLLEQSPDPSVAEIREALSGNICRCTGYGAIVRAVQEAAGGVS